MEAKTKKRKVWTYSPYHSYKFIHEDESKDVTMQSQLYQASGVYVILNNDPGMQFTSTPAIMVKVEKQLKKDELAGKITNLVFSPFIKVTTDDDGFFIQIDKDEKHKEKVD